jgi:D-alanyl-lipoteichoic acid acyltransferase DltB (MBOAT superfamily)
MEPTESTVLRTSDVVTTDLGDAPTRATPAAAAQGHPSVLLLLFGAVGLSAVVLAAASALRTMLSGSMISVSQITLALAGCASLALGWEARGTTIAGVVAGRRSWVTVDALARFAAVAAQFSLLVLVMQEFRIETPAFYEHIMPLALAGFLLHAVLPLRQRLLFFVLLSLAGILLVFGPRASTTLVGIGLGLVALCHLPVPFRFRVALLVAAGCLLAALRVDLIASGVPPAIWPILGSMFMFRLITYMYDLRHSKAAPDWRRTLAYFFLLPNVAFPLFPVVDFSTFRRTYYDQEAVLIYQRGVQWMLRGVLHLLMYRLVYTYLLISPHDVVDPTSLVRHMLATFLLYLKVSGQFHVIVGLLHMFGFRLPETHHFFYLASSFTDFWRRINIYWKDFMMKVVYYPAFFRLRRFGTTPGLILATLVVFFSTWLLHAYQWFWLLGTMLLTLPDMLFWALLAVLLIINTLIEAQRGRDRALGTRQRGPLASARHALKVAGTFAVICVLWSLWSTESVGEWILLWQTAFSGSSGGDVAWRPELLLLGVVATGMVMGGAPPPTGGGGRKPSFTRTALATTVVITLLLGLGSSAFVTRLDAGPATVIRDLRVPRLNQRDSEDLQRGYYESLTLASRQNAALWEVYARRSQDWPNVARAGIAKLTGGFEHWELRPLVGTVFHGAPLRTNRWGMRDRDYEQKPAPGVFRIALLGASYVMGDGVADNETFEWLVEEWLEAEREEHEPVVEILNFAVPSYFPARHLDLMHRKVFDFEPHAIFIVGHPSDGMDYAHVLAKAALEGGTIPFDFLRAPVEREAIGPGMRRQEAIRRLMPYSTELLAETYRRIVADASERNIRPVYVFIPTPNVEDAAARAAPLLDMTRDAGFTVIDLADVYSGEDLRSLWLVSWDYHPNARGHEIIAERLHRALHEHGGILPRSIPAHLQAEKSPGPTRVENHE